MSEARNELEKQIESIREYEYKRGYEDGFFDGQIQGHKDMIEIDKRSEFERRQRLIDKGIENVI